MESSMFRLLLAGGLFTIIGLCAAAQNVSTPSRGLLLVANKGEHTLGIIDPAQARQVATVDEGGITGHEVTASADGRRAFVPIYGNSGVGMPGTDGSTVAVFDLATHKLVDTINLGK